jgi:predicted HAD superfamily Cof-like phosphohydrolase
VTDPTIVKKDGSESTVSKELHSRNAEKIEAWRRGVDPEKVPEDPRFIDPPTGQWEQVWHNGRLLANLRIPRSSNYSDVHAFHQKFGLLPPPVPTLLNEEQLTFRRLFMIEEQTEFLQAHAGGDLAGAADALVDLVYVVMGTGVLMGLPWQELWNRVQHANMSKVRAQRAEDSKRGSTLDVIKPDGWQPPDHLPVLKRYGWKP